MTTTILIVDDENFFRERLGRAFDKRNYQVYLAADYNEAKQIVE